MIPKRALGAAVGTLLGLALLVNFKTPTATSLATETGVDTGTDGAVAQATPAPTDSTDTGSASGSTDTSSGTTSDPTTSAGYADGTYTGSTVSNRYGDVQVQVTISGGQLVDVTALQLPDGDRHSASISSQVEPWLREAALTAQSAQIDLVSGATYTSRSYAESLQSALDAAAA